MKKLRNDEEISKLHRRRLDSLIRALRKYFLKTLEQGSYDRVKKLPKVKEIFRLVSSQSIFARHSAPGSEAISFNSFNQDWKKIYRPLVRQHFNLRN